MIWFIADTHFGHARILEFRNLSCVEEMDTLILESINSRVKRNDILYHLGDFCHKRPGHYRMRINCKQVHLVRGNHDKASWGQYFSTFEHMVFIKKHKLHLCHYPLETWQWMYYRGIHLHGHSHGRLPPQPRRLDVGFDCIGPVSLEEINGVSR